MRGKALAAARTAGLENVEVRVGDAMSLPLDNETVDIVISNGVLNLRPRQIGCISRMQTGKLSATFRSASAICVIRGSSLSQNRREIRFREFAR